MARLMLSVVVAMLALQAPASNLMRTEVSPRGSPASLKHPSIAHVRHGDLILIKTTASQIGYDNVKYFWAPFIAKLRNKQHVVVSIDVTPENPALNAKHDWRKIPAMGNFIYDGTSAQNNKIRKHKSLKALVKKLQEVAPRAMLHICSAKDMLHSYPALAESVKNSHHMWPHPVGWGYNYVSSLMAWKLLKAQGSKFAHVWEFEDDVRFAKVQDLIDFMSENKRKREDLLVPSEHVSETTDDWIWTDVGSQAYLASTSAADSSSPQATIQGQKCSRVHSDVWATRASAKLMEMMHHWCAVERKCAYGEQFAQTVAKCNGLRISQMRGTNSLIRGSGGGIGAGYDVAKKFKAFRIH